MEPSSPTGAGPGPRPDGHSPLPDRAGDAGPREEVSASGPSRGRRRKVLTRTASILIFALVFNNLVIPQLGGARRAVDLIGQVNPLLLLVALGLEMAALVAYAQLTRVALDEPTMRLSTMVRIQLSTKAVTNLVPGGSAAGTTVGYRLLTNADVSSAHAGFALATVGLGSAVLLNLLLWAALLITIPMDGFNPAYGSAALVGAILLMAVGALILLLSRGRRQADRVVRAIARPIPFVNEDTASRFVGTLASRLKALGDQPTLVRRGLMWSTVNWACDAASLWVFLKAFGGTVNPAQLLVAFCLANVLAVIPITPGGLGVVEAVLTSTLVGFGLDRATAAIGVVTYRVAAFWLPIPLGALAYTSLRVGPLSLRNLRRRHPIRALAHEAEDVAEVRVWDVPDPPAEPAEPADG